MKMIYKNATIRIFSLGLVLVSMISLGTFMQSCSSNFEDNLFVTNDTKDLSGFTPFVTGGKLDATDSRIISLKASIKELNDNQNIENNRITEKIEAGDLAWDNSVFVNQGNLSGVLVPFGQEKEWIKEILFLSSFSVEEKTETFVVQLNLDDEERILSTSFYTLEGKPLKDSYIISQISKESNYTIRLKDGTEGSGSSATLTNNTNTTVYFKPEETTTVNGITYNTSSSYPLYPGQSTNIPIDGCKVTGGSAVLKLTNGYSSCVVSLDNGCYRYDATYSNTFYYAYFLVKGGMKDNSWLAGRQLKGDNTWNSLFSR